ncbi:methyl-accepting chemotaxis protein [Achromobacter insuavis]|uniref:methyl-accepting chemotaxis protein n=1 Tax=Achromobacter insuavis TaxID=1287735 RepID=UPI000E2FFD41|nr:methyl-accepting chemotaxis protein [Achromobacter insuavis]
MLSNLKVRTGLMLAQLAVAVAALVAIALGWNSMRSNAEAINALDSLSVQQSNLVKDSYVQMLRATIRADIAAAQRAAGDKAGAAENTRIVQQLLTDGKAKLEKFKAIPKTTDIGRAAEGQLLASFNGFAEGLQAMLGALDRGDNAEYLNLKNTKTAAASGAFSKQLTEFATAITTYSEERVAGSRSEGAVMAYVYLALVLVILAVSLGAFLFMNRVVLRPLRTVGESFDRIAAGDLTTRVEVQSTNEIGALMAAVKRMQESLARTVSTVRRGVDEINVGSREISAGNTDLSSRTEEQAASLEETAASMEQLASTVKQNADNARQANQLAASASDVAERGGSAVAEVVNTMQGISASSRKISEIVSVIDGIAFQTNILALNAAVEAARAGEQGKGFAVVAGEVRSLAQRSAQAAKEIKGLIEDSVTKVGAGSQQVERAGATMQEIVASVKRVTDIMGEISAASEEQSSGIDQVNRAVSQMDEVTQQNAALVEEAAAAAGSLQEQAQRLAEAVAVFKINTGDVIEVPARQLAQQRSAPRVVAPKVEEAAPVQQKAVAPAEPAPRQAAPAARLTHTAPRAKTAPVVEAASAARPLRRPAPRAATAAANDAKPAPAATRRQAPADDDWESF